MVVKAGEFRRSNIFYFLLLLVVTFLFYFRFLSGERSLLFHDLKTHHHPWRVFNVHEYLEGRFPLWNPFNAFGFPHLAEGEAGPLYPLSIIPYLITESPYAIFIYSLIHSFMGCFWTFLFLLRSGLSRTSSITGGVVFAFSGLMISRIIYPHWIGAVVYLPLLLYLIKRGFETDCGFRRSLSNLLPLCIPVSLTILAGHPQGAGLVLFFSGIYSLFLLLRSIIEMKDSRARTLLNKGVPLLISYIFGMLLSLPQLIPTLELTRFSVRGEGVSQSFATQGKIPPIELIRLLFPESFGIESPQDIEIIYHHRGERYFGRGENFWETTLYVGVLPFLFGLLSFFRGRWRFDEKTFMRVMLILSLLLMLGDSTPIYPIFRNLPPFSFFRMPSRFSLWFLICLIHLSSEGFDSFLSFIKGGKSLASWERGMRRFIHLCTVSAIILPIVLFALNQLLIKGRERLFEFGEKHYRQKIEIYSKMLGEGRIVEPHELHIPELHDMEYYRKRILLIYEELLKNTDVTGKRVLIPFLMLLLPLILYLMARIFKVEPFLSFCSILLFMATAFDLFVFEMRYLRGVAPAMDGMKETSDILRSEKKGGHSRFAILHRRSGVEFEEPLLTPSLNLLEDLEEVLIPSPLTMVRVDRLLDSSGLGLAIYNLDIEKEYQKRRSLLIKNLPLAGLMNIKDILSVEDIDGSGDKLEKIGMAGGVRIYRNSYFLPRAFLSPSCSLLEEEEVFKRLEDGDFRPEQVLLLKGEVDEGVCEDRGEEGWRIGDEASRVRIHYPSPRELEIELKGDRPGILFISDTFYPGWKAWKNGKEAKILRAFGIFRAVFIEEGDRMVRMEYRPLSFTIPFYIAISSLFILIGTLLCLNLRRR